MKKRIFISSILSLISTHAAAELTTAPDLGRFTGNTLVSNNIGVFGGDIMQPMLGNNNGFVYGDVNGDGATNDSWLISPGLGFRNLANNVIYGMYAYGDYQQTNIGGHLWVINPGVEIMTPRWDAHLNAYIAPNRAVPNGATVFADTLGIDQGILPSGNTLEDTQVNPLAVFGNGLDADLGYSFPYKNNLRARVSLGGYNYQVPSGFLSTSHNVLGITGGVKLALSPAIAVAVNDSYDNVFNNIAGLSLSYSFGNEDNDNLYSDDVSDRLLAPNIRHVGIIQTGAGQMPQQNYELANGGAEAVQFTNVFYFVPTLPASTSQIAGAGGLGAIGLGQCTAQNPCGNSALNQTTIDDLYADPQTANAKFFLSTGTFDATGGLTFHEGQGIYGWNTGFTSEASGTSRPLLDNSIDLDGGNNILKNIQIDGKETPVNNYGLSIDSTATGSIDIENTNIVEDQETAASGYNIALQNESAANILISNSSLSSAFAGSTSTFRVVGLLNSGAGTIEVNHSTINATGDGPNLPDAAGIINSVGTINVVNNSTVTVSSNYFSVGLSNPISGVINFNDSTLVADAPFGAIAANGADVNFSGSTCVLNGVSAAC